MLRLWPEHFLVGLFDGYCWLQGRNGTERIEQHGDVLDGTESLFRQAIERIAQIGGKKSRVSVLLSDSFARIALLPWQPQVLAEPQLRAYTLACFDRAGIKVGAEYAVHSAYRHFGHPAMAVALPNQLLDGLSMQAAQSGVRLHKVSTSCAAAYWNRAGRWRRDDCALYLCERDRLTVMRVQKGRFTALDVQPVGGDVALALRRLAQRDMHGYPRRIELWAPHGHEIDSVCFTEMYPEAELTRLATDSWRLA